MAVFEFLLKWLWCLYVDHVFLLWSDQPWISPHPWTQWATFRHHSAPPWNDPHDVNDIGRSVLLTTVKSSIIIMIIIIVIMFKITINFTKNFLQSKLSVFRLKIWIGKILRRSSQGNPFGEGVKRKRVAKYSDFGALNAISRKRCKIGGNC